MSKFYYFLFIVVLLGRLSRPFKSIYEFYWKKKHALQLHVPDKSISSPFIWTFCTFSLLFVQCIKKKNRTADRNDYLLKQTSRYRTKKWHENCAHFSFVLYLQIKYKANGQNYQNGNKNVWSCSTLEANTMVCLGYTIIFLQINNFSWKRCHYIIKRVL